MDIEDVVFDAENNATSLSLQFQLLAIKFTREKDLKARHKLLEKCKHLLINFKRAVLINRRRYQQRMQRRQSLMRFTFIQHLMELETHIFELFPIHQLNGVQKTKQS